MAIDRITRLVLHGNRRLLTKKTMTLDYDVVEDLQVIIGGNGYGKSTVFEELSPLPGVKKNYIDSGYKKIFLEANGHKYELTSTFKKGNHHEFLKDGVELNDGHTLPVQRALVEKEFGYTVEIHNLLIGRVEFTSMSEAQRKEWLAKLSPSSVDYAIDIYKKVATEVRHGVGAAKNLKEKLAEVERDLLSDEEVQRLDDTVKAIHETIAQLHARVLTIEPATEREVKAYQNFDVYVQGINTRINELRAKLSQDSKTFDHIEQKLEQATREQAVQENNMKLFSDEYHNLQDTIADMSWSDGRDSNAIADSVALAKAEIAKLDDVIQWRDLIDQFPDPRQVIDMVANNAVDITFSEALSQLEPNPKLELYSKHRLESLRKEHMKITNERTALENQMAVGRAKLKEAEAHPELVCPNCTHHFRDSHLDPLRINAFLTAKAKESDALSDSLNDLMMIIADNVRWDDSMTAINTLFSTYGPLKPFWNWVDESGLLLTNPKGLIGKIEFLIQQLTLKEQYDKYQKDISDNEEILRLRAASEQRSTANTRSRLTMLEERIDEGQRILQDTKQDIAVMSSDLEIYNRLLHERESLGQLFEAYKAGFKAEMVQAANRAIWDEIEAETKRVGMIAETLTKSTSKLAVAKHIAENLKEINERLEVDRLLLDKLSPTKGLIADVLMGFIIEFVRQANEIKSKFWTTELELLPCQLTERGLDYKFPMRSTSEAYPTDDVKNGSLGEKELMNFLFMMVARNFMGLNEMPLFLDEVGARFHENNRSRLYQYVKVLVGAGWIKQVFVISHFESTYRSLSHAQMNVLDPTGVLVDPEVHNLHFKLKTA